MGALTKSWYVLLFLMITGLFLYDNVWGRLKDISKEGIERESQIFGDVINVSDDYFYFHTGFSDIRIESANMPLIIKAKYGETVVHARRLKNGDIIGIDYHNYDYNYLLYFLSFIAFIIFLAIFFKEWKITLRGFEDA